MKTVETLNGSKIYIGQNAKENDMVTFEMAYPDDLWVHAKDAPGSHVVIHGPCTPECIREAAKEALAHSKAIRPIVDICKVGHVKKFGGASPGQVQITNSWTYKV
jgi:predicted ribosome quality control (RQC) complex YloA/Tae2 family protein